LGSAVCCYGGLCCWTVSMLLRWAVLLGSAVCCYGGLCCWTLQYVITVGCVVGQCSILLRWSVGSWAVQYVVTVGCVFEQCSTLLRWAVCCWALQYGVMVGCVVRQCSMFLLWICLMERSLVIVMSLNWNLRTRNTRTLKLAQICLKPTSHSDYSSPVPAILTGTHSTSVANVPSVSSSESNCFILILCCLLTILYQTPGTEKQKQHWNLCNGYWSNQ